MTYQANSSSLVGSGVPGHVVSGDIAARAARRAHAVPERPREWDPGILWWDAHTVLVTYPTAPQRSGTVKHLVVSAGYGRLAFPVSSQSAEAQHLAHDWRVIVQAGDWRGSPALGSRQHYGTAESVRTGPLFDKVQAGIRTKYAKRVGLARLAHRLALGAAPYGDIAVVVTVHED
ncbi:hypothetical protein IU459_31500 [Nocardia amamiensis]|uniref:PPOX class F420-dependent enzyme n=1 Tax=Nocardia amamiensis TaxID=404578 RepID=A0ABS0D4E1_9NOCA|nr:hypothetical protein [Nocardia amamiensis]MBF6302039.1 hypothetical protein [Nocardia amamiensis]